MNLSSLENKTKEIRIDILTMLTESGSGHTGGSLSLVDSVADDANKFLSIQDIIQEKVCF